MLSTPLHNERELLLRTAQGDEGAFSELFNRYKHEIYHIALKFSKSIFIAEEVVQDIFLKIWINRASLAHVENFAGYLYTAIRNRSFSLLKRMARQELLTKEVGREETFLLQANNDLHEARDLQRLLSRAIDQLPPQQRKVYRLIRIQGYSRQQAADELGLNANTIKAHLSEASRRVRSLCMAWIEAPVLILWWLIH